MTTSTVTQYLSEDENKSKQKYFVNIQIQLQTYLVHSFMALVSAFLRFGKKYHISPFCSPTLVAVFAI